MGDTDAATDRYGGGARGVHLPEPEFEFMVGGPEL